MKSTLTLFLFLLLLHNGSAQNRLAGQLLFGAEFYTHYRTPSLSGQDKYIQVGTPLVNPSIGLSGILRFNEKNDVMTCLKLNVCTTYSPFNIVYGKEHAQGAVNFLFAAGPAIYFSQTVQMHLMYGYQLNMVDMDGTNKAFSSSDRWYGLHTIECAIGAGLGDILSVVPFARVGFNTGAAFSLHFGFRIGISPEK